MENNENVTLVKIGAQIKELRNKMGLSQAELGKALFTTRGQISYWENADRVIKVDDIIRIADFFNVSCDEIMRGIKAENVNINRELGLTDKAIEVLKLANNPDMASAFNNVDINWEQTLSKNTTACINALLEERAHLGELRVIDCLQRYLCHNGKHEVYHLEKENSRDVETLYSADILAIRLLQLQQAVNELKRKIDIKKNGGNV